MLKNAIFPMLGRFARVVSLKSTAERRVGSNPAGDEYFAHPAAISSVEGIPMYHFPRSCAF